MANPNIVNVTTILGKTSVLAVTTTPTDIVVNAAASDTVLKINNLTIANIDGTNAADITASIFRSSVEYKFANTISVPADSSLVILDKNTSIYLEEGDSIRLTSSANSDLQGIVSYEVIS